MRLPSFFVVEVAVSSWGEAFCLGRFVWGVLFGVFCGGRFVWGVLRRVFCLERFTEGVLFGTFCLGCFTEAFFYPKFLQHHSSASCVSFEKK